MANIVNADYESFPAYARQIRNFAQELNQELESAYKTIGEMHDSWNGIRYTTLAMAFDDIREKVNKLLDLVVREIPYALEAFAKNYAIADQNSKVPTVSETPAKMVPVVDTPTDVGIKFLSAKVNDSKEKVIANLKSAKEKMEMIDNTNKKIVWESEAADAYRNTFRTLKNNIVESFDNIERDFTTLMNQTLEDIENAEKANTL